MFACLLLVGVWAIVCSSTPPSRRGSVPPFLWEIVSLFLSLSLSYSLSCLRPKWQGSARNSSNEHCAPKYFDCVPPNVPVEPSTKTFRKQVRVVFPAQHGRWLREAHDFYLFRFAPACEMTTRTISFWNHFGACDLHELSCSALR